MTTPEAIKKLYTALGGDGDNVAEYSKNVEMLNAVCTLLGAPDGSNTIPECVDMIASVAGGFVKPTGTIGITANGNNIDVAAYAKANVNVPASAVVSGTKPITANGTGIDVTNYAAVDVNVSGGGAPNIGSITVSNTTSSSITIDSLVYASNGKVRIEQVEVAAGSTATIGVAYRLQFGSDFSVGGVLLCKTSASVALEYRTGVSTVATAVHSSSNNGDFVYVDMSNNGTLTVVGE